MKPEVGPALYDLTVKREGSVLGLYLDVLRLVTFGLGNLGDPVGLALAADWVHPDGSVATEAEVRAAWNIVKSDHTLDPKNGGVQYLKLTTIRTTSESVARVCAGKLASFEQQVAPHFDDWEGLPWQAQLCVLSMAWACGGLLFEHNAWPSFRAAVNSGNWAEAAKQCQMKEIGQNASFHQRNLADAALLLECA